MTYRKTHRMTQRIGLWTGEKNGSGSDTKTASETASTKIMLSNVSVNKEENKTGEVTKFWICLLLPTSQINFLLFCPKQQWLLSAKLWRWHLTFIILTLHQCRHSVKFICAFLLLHKTAESVPYSIIFLPALWNVIMLFEFPGKDIPGNTGDIRQVMVL